MKLKLAPLLIFLTCLPVLNSCAEKNHPPLVSNQQFSVAENSSPGTVVGKVVAADLDNDTIFTYSIVGGNPDNAFEISSTTGTITVKNDAILDFESTPEFDLMVQVRDSRNAATNAAIKVNLENVAPPTDGLILYMPFEGNLKDSSGLQNNGQESITVGSYAAGRSGQALDFNGNSNYVKLTNTLNSGYGLSFSFWMKSRGANGLENNGAIVAKYSSSADARCFMIYSFGSSLTRTDNRLAAAFYADGSSALLHDQTKSYWEPADLLVYPTDPSFWTIINPQRILLDTWTHVVVNVTTTHVEVWFNGEICTKKQREYPSYYNSSSEPTYLGDNLNAGDGTNNHFNGILDELRVYGRELTNDDIKTLFKEN